MTALKLAGADWQVVAENILVARKIQGLTQAELAAKAAVSIPSVYRAEKAQPVRINTLRKIANPGLNVQFDTLLIRKARMAEDIKVSVHRASHSTWHALSDRRPRLPDDHLDSYQKSDERARLGSIGFVSAFMAPPNAIMKDGPGLVLLELFDEMREPFNSEFYKDAVVYILSGKAIVTVLDQDLEVEEGDWVGFHTADLVALRPAELSDNSRRPITLLWIGANRHRRAKRG